MEQIMEMLSFESFYYTAAIVVLLLVIIILLFMEISTKRKLKKVTDKYEVFMGGKDAKKLEETVFERFEQVDKLWDFTKNNEREIAEIKENLLITYQKVGLVKYDAYNEMGGKLSFVLCMLDKDNNGFMMNSMHNREGCYTYVKEIFDGEAQVVLSEEETKALEKAVNGK